MASLPFLALALSFAVLSGLATYLDWTEGKELFFLFASALNGMAVVHLILLGILGELVVGTSDLTHTQLPETTKQIISVSSEL